MDLSPARMAEMLAPLAQSHNDQERAQKAARPTTLTGWDLAKLWMVADACNSVKDFDARADVSIHVRKVGLPLLETAGWLERKAAGRARVFEPTIPAAALEERRQGNATPLIFSDVGARAAGRLQTGAGSTDPEGMNTPPFSVNVTVHIEFTGLPDGVRQRTTIGNDGAPAHDQSGPDRAPAHRVSPDAVRQRTTANGHGAPAHDDAADTVRQRTALSVDRAPAHPQRAADALNRGSQSSLSSTPSQRQTDRSVVHEGGEEVGPTPGQADAISRTLLREVEGLEYSSPNGGVPTLVDFFRRYNAGHVFATFLSIVEEQGMCNIGALNQWVRTERAGWSHAATRDALVRFGVHNHATAAKFAHVMCPATVQTMSDFRAEIERKGGKIKNPTGWAPTTIASGTPYERAFEAAQQRFKGREAERRAIDKRQLAEAAAKAKAKTTAGAAADDAAEAAEVRRVVESASCKDLAAAIERVKSTAPGFAARIARRQGELRTKNPSAKPGELLRTLAQSPSLIGAVYDALTAKEPTRG